MVAVGNVNDLVKKLGNAPELIDAKIGQLAGSPLEALKTLGLSYSRAALADNKFGRTIQDGRIEIPPFGQYPGPREVLRVMRRYVGSTYYAASFEPHPSRDRVFERLLHPRRRQGMLVVRRLHTDANVRAGFERLVGGQVVLDGRADGSVTVAVGALTSGTSAPGPNPRQGDIYDYLMAMDAAVVQQANEISMNQSSFGGMTRGVGGVGKGDILGSTSIFGLSTAESLGVDGTGADGGNNSVDVGVLRLKRLLDKRDQMYTLVKNVWDKYNQSAKSTIDNVRA